MLVPLLLGSAVVVLAVGIWLPMLTTDRLLEDPKSYSVVTGVADLFRVGKPHFAILILAVSILFPLGKLVALGMVWFKGSREVLDMAGVELRAGMWLLASSALLFIVLSWWGRRNVRA